MKGESIGWMPPPPEDLAMEAINALFPKKEPRPPPRTLADDLPVGISDPGIPPPPLKLPEPTVLVKERAADELVPAFSKTWRASLNDLMRCPWIAQRLVARSPHLSISAAQALLRGTLQDPFGFFQMSEHAILAARYLRDSFLPPHVEMMFLLHTDRGPEGGHIKGSQGEKDAVQLLRGLRDWAKHQGASAITRMSDVNDLPPSVIVQELKGQRRDEVWMAIE